MTDNEYLARKLKEQSLEDGSDEAKALEKRGREVKALLEKHFSDSTPTIGYGGSKAKGTMIKAAYDLDLICYFPRDDEDAGGTLKDIYENTERALQGEYFVERKASALRLKGKSGDVRGLDFHVDVVPGRYIGGDAGDVFLYQSTGDKQRLKTNPNRHIQHVRGSGVTPAIKLLKLWRWRNQLRIKHFVLELLAIDLLSAKKGSLLTSQLMHVWTAFRDSSESLSVKDPANEEGNDLSSLLDASVRSELERTARATLDLIESGGWVGVFDELEGGDEADGGKLQVLQAAAAAVVRPTKPWHPA